MPMSTAVVEKEYNASSVTDPRVMAVCRSAGLSDAMRTKKTTMVTMVTTVTKMPQNNPLLAREQSTEYVWCR